MEVANLRIEKLRGKDNWQQWRFIIRTLLEEDDNMLEVCEGTLVRPDERSTNYEAKLRCFVKADKAARKLIVTTVEKKPLDLLLSCTTAREMWKKLNAVYDMKSEENLSLVQKQFFDFKWEINENVAHNLSKVEQLASKMKSLGSEVPDSMLVTRILCTLPKKFSHFHSAWDSVEESKKNLENLTARLMSEEMRAAEQFVEEETVALMTKSRFDKKQYKSGQNNHIKKNVDIVCYICGRKGHKKKDCDGCYTCGSKNHLSRNCFKRRENFRERSNTQSVGSNQGQRNSTSKQAFVGSCNVEQDNTFWLIDSGASDHMTYQRELFCDFEEFEVPLDVKIGNGENISAYGKGSIEVETIVNGEWIEGVMHDVLFVPGLRQNLFSVKVVAKKEVNFSITNCGKKCLFTRDGTVIATGTDSGNLYKINLRVILPKKCNLIEKVDKNQNTDKSGSLQLWHERLCHQNKRDVILSRDVVFKLEKVCSNVVNITNLKENNEVAENSVENNNETAVESAEEEEKSTETLQFSKDSDENVRELRDRRRIKHTDFYGCPITCVAEAFA
ncbi:Retrovirus-related Pol polyprotein from transposon TNT 1-94 [Anthophora plagiata]